MSKIDKKGLTKAQLEYIENIEAELQLFKNDGAKRLLSELSGIAGDFADDLVKIRCGEGVGVYINENANDKMIDKVMKLVDKMDKFKLLAQLSSPEEEVKEVKKSIRGPED
ncbi:MAG: hypothetical protein ACK5XN_02770, partial [Bacteroidota bacterium]